MQSGTLLLRQVNPQWVKDGRILSLAFRPFPRDEGLLSVYDGDQIAARDSWVHFTQQQGFNSAGVWAVTVAESQECGLSSRPDPLPGNLEHAVIDFTAHARKQQEAKSKMLAAKAQERGCLFGPDS